ncbi:MAG: acyl-CoA desaturase [Pseudomonadota bacterium]
MRPEVFRVDGANADPVHGRVVWSPLKSMWINACLLAFVGGALFATTPSAVVLFMVSTYLSLLLGHSIGMHRKLIHRTFSCSKTLERVLVYLGVLVGMAGPFGLIRVHDIRDWAQREPVCHDFFSHRRPLWQDALWQLNCRFQFDRPPTVTIETEVADDPFYRFLEKTWVLQQLPVAGLLFVLGGWPWVVWGIFGRVFISVAGHWTVTYLTHNPGPGRWLVPAAGVQASNLCGAGFITMGECWHNNHHAFPESARIGLSADETDPGWNVLQAFESLGWVWDLGGPRDSRSREDLTEVATKAGPLYFR